MRLASVDIRDYRSIFIDDDGTPLRLDLAAGSNSLVGQNNCGKSNVLRAISLALDPNHEIDADADAPGPRPFALPIVTLHLHGDTSDELDAAALAAAEAYERAAGAAAGTTRASAGDLTLEVSFQPGVDRVIRSERLVTSPHVQPPTDPDTRALMVAAISAVRDAVRFVLISSGESIESVLEGNFREILHSVVQQRLHDEFSTAEDSRRSYVSGLQDSLLGPLRDRLAADVGGMFPEIGSIALSPEVSSIEETLSNVEVTVADLVDTPLSGKGTGVRGGLLVAMLQYLASNATKSMVFAVEEPEAFLHPAAQEDLRDHLETLAAIEGVTLLVTTHSPFTVTRSATGRVFCLAKDTEGRTRVAESASGDADHAPLIGGLMRPASLESLLSSFTAIPAGTEAVVLVEGDGDRFCMNLVADVVGRPDLLAGLYVRPTGGTVHMLAEAIIVRAAVTVPVVIVVDNDLDGREARKSLTGEKVGFAKQRVITYAEAFGGGQWPNFGVEAEDLFEPDLIAAFVEEHGASVITGSQKRPDDAFHYDFSQAAKEKLESWLSANVGPHHLERWVEMVLLIRTRAGLSVPAQSAAEIVAAAPKATVSDDLLQGTALIVAGQHDYARYLDTSALVLDTGFAIPSEATHAGFYAKGIQPHLPRIVADHPHLLLVPHTVSQLRATGKDVDSTAADVIEHVMATDPTLVGATRRVLLLSAPDDAETIALDQPIANSKQLAGRPVAWTVGPKLVPVQPFTAPITTTDELDAAISKLDNSQGADA